MVSMDVFNSDPFSMMEMTGAVESVPYAPGLLGAIPGLFVPKPVRTKAVAVESRAGILSVIQTSPRGAPLEQRTTEKRVMRYFETPRIAKGDRLEAHEIDGIRAFGQETELMQVQDEVMRRLGGPTGLRVDVELTHERMRLGAVQGIVVDADESVLYNWYTEFGVSQPAEIDFELDDATTDVRKKCAEVTRKTSRALQMGQLQMLPIYGLASDGFWDDLIGHKSVRETWLNQQEAAELRKDSAWQSLYFGGITFVNYRGTDDNSKVAVPADKCKFFPAVPGVFEAAYSPAETFDFVNTPGKPIYSMIVPDKDRNAFVDIEVYSYPLFICKRPAALMRAKKA